MIISTVTVGIIATNAAYAGDSVGWNTSRWLMIKGPWDSWTEHFLDPSTGYEIDLSSYSAGDHVNFNICARETDGGTLYYFTDQANIYTSTGQEFRWSGSNNTTTSTLSGYFNVASPCKITIQLKWDGQNPYLKITNVNVVNNTFYLRDKTNSRDYTFTATSTTGVYTTEVTLGANETIQCYPRSGANDSGDFYGNSGATTLDDLNDSTQLFKYGTPNTSHFVPLKSNNLGAGKYTLQWDVRDTGNYQLKLIGFAASNRTVTYGVCTGQTSMGTVTATKNNTSIGTSPASVANNSSVVFTATPNFGYEFAGWKTSAAGTTAHAYGTTNPKTASITGNVTVYASFVASTADPYYIGGRFAVATSAANIHSSTIYKDGVEQYGETLNNGAGLDGSTNSALGTGTSTNYWSFKEGSTNLKFTLQSGSTPGSREYIFNTYRTVKQLSEDKDKLYTDYGGDRDDYHDPFYFIIHDKVHRFGGTDSSGNNFQNQNSEANALSLSSYSGTVKESNEIRFNNYNSQSNGWVRIHLKENGYNPATGSGGNPLIWYEIVDETPPAAANVRISASPARVDRNASGNNVTLKGSYVADSRNAPADSITYTFYKSTDGKSWTQIGTANSLSDTYSYQETSTASTMYYKVTVGSTATTGGGLNYDTRSATTSVEIYASGLFMSNHISGNTTPTWSNDLKAYAGYDYPFKRTTSTTYTNSNPYIFTLSSITGWDPDMAKYTIDEASNQFCTIEYEIKDVTIDEEHASVVTYKVIPNPNCKNPRIYVDFKNKKVWAIADYTPTAKGKTSSSSETVRYYFAERKDDSGQSNAANNTTKGPATGMRIHYWNNSNPDNLNGDKTFTTQFIPSGKSNNSIYVNTDYLYHQTGNYNGIQEFYVYYVDLPIWATSFQFRTGANGTFNAVPTISKDQYITNHSITLNPNRIYCLFNASSGDDWRVKGVILDESMWNNSRTGISTGNEVTTYKVETNLIDYTDNTRLQSPYKPNGALSSLYSSKSTPHSLYFGFMATQNSAIDTGMTGIDSDKDYYNWGTMLYGFDGKNKAAWAKNLAQRKNSHSFYASVQDLVGMTTSTTKFNTNGDGATFGYLMDTKANNESTTGTTYGKSTAVPHPVFDYTSLPSASAGSGTDAHNATSLIKQGLKFPFYQSTINGITTYSYDSTTDRNRVYNGTDFAVQAASNNTGFATGSNGDNKNTTGLFPFGGNTNHYDHCGYGIEFDMNFYMSNTGYLTDANGNAKDIAFNFSGDDDVWVFVDGIKVLDLGGEHNVSAATINFTDKKVYYKSSANSIGNATSVKDNWAQDDNNYINVVDLGEIMAAYGKPFDSTDASTKHTFQMFYLERGAFESNCVIDFNLPQASGLNIKNNVTVDNVNPALQKDTLFATNPDYFTYSLQAKLVNGTLPAAITNKNAKAAATTATGLDFSKPLYPYTYETKRVYDDGSNPITTYVLSTAGGTGTAGSELSYNKSSWTSAVNTVYELSDEHLVATTEGKAHVTGKTDASGNGIFHLLGGQMATFNDKVPQNAYVKVSQSQNLGTVDDSTPVGFETVTNNKTGSYYISSYSIYDEKSKDYIVRKTPFTIDFDNDHYAKDNDLDGTDGANGFYFSNYTGDAEDINPAMRVDFYNDVAVGTIRIDKELDDHSFSNAKFSFKVKLGRLFGSGSETLKEYPGLEYKLYYSDGTLIGTRWYNSQSGIVLSPGQYAEIEGIPVETYYEVEEVPAAGYSFTKLVKTSKKLDGSTIHYNNVDTTANEYSQTILAPNAPKTTDATTAVEDGFKIYKNMIPPVQESLVGTPGSSRDYNSQNRIVFTNQRETFTITFKYYDRDVTNNVPASISNVVSSYSVTLKNLDDYIYTKNGSLPAGYEYLADLPGIEALDDGAFVAYNYEKMIKDKSVEFVENTGTGVSNLIDDYSMWTRQKKAVTGLQGITNLKTGEKYTAAEAVYHTTSNGQPNTSGEKWVNYLSNEGTSFDPENVASATADFHAGDLSKYENIKSIVVWLYNTPREYTVNVYGAKTTSDLNTAKDITLKGSGITVSGARVAKVGTSSKYTNVKGYYSQRLGREIGDPDYLDKIAYLDVYDVPAIVEQNNEFVRPEFKADETINGLEFAYWAYDAEGTQVASTDYKFGYRITGDFDLYAVYAPAKLTSSQFGLTIVEDAPDAFIDSAGNAKVRINTMFNPYNLPDYDTNIKRAAVVNVYITKLIREGLSDSDIKDLMDKYSGQLKTMLANNSFTALSIAETSPALNVELTTKGYVKLVNSGSSSIDLTNKNRIEFTTQFNKSQLYTDGNVGILQYGAMAYDINKDNTISSDEWILSDNTILRKFQTS